jgi:hypothetical protein
MKFGVSAQNRIFFLKDETQVPQIVKLSFCGTHVELVSPYKHTFQPKYDEF